MKARQSFLMAILAYLAMCVPSTLLAGQSAPAEPLYVYSFAGNPNVEHNLGVVAQALLMLGELPNKPLKEKLDTVLSQRNRREQFRQVFGCLLIGDTSTGCRNLVFLANPPFKTDSVPSDEVTALMRRDGVSSVWTLHVTEQFHVGGYFLSAGANRIYVDASGRQNVHTASAMYRASYSNQLDAKLRSIDVKAKGVTPPFGSKEAKAAFWYEGEPSRLETEIANSPLALADLLSILLALPVGSRTVSSPEEYKKLPKLGRLAAAGEASCRAAYCGTRVRREFPERIVVEVDWRGRPWLLSVPRWEY